MTLTITEVEGAEYADHFVIEQDGQPIARSYNWYLANRAAGEITKERAKRAGALTIEKRNEILLKWKCELCTS
jgi:hypothetical protein